MIWFSVYIVVKGNNFYEKKIANWNIIFRFQKKFKNPKYKLYLKRSGNLKGAIFLIKKYCFNVPDTKIY